MKFADILVEAPMTQAERKRRVEVKHDQWYTQPEAAAQFSSWVKSKPFFKHVSRMIDPAAGSGETTQHFPGIKAYDLDPQSPEIQQADFLKSNFKYQPGTLVVSNVPFGENSRLAIQFFNKAAQFADYIAMVLPRSFRRDTIQRNLDKNFHLVDEYILPRNSFYWPAEGDEKKPVDVGAVAQIWKRSKQQRVDAPRLQSIIPYTTKNSATIAFRRIGRRAGEIITGKDIAATNPGSFFYVDGDRALLSKMRAIDWSTYGNDVIGARSISKQDIIKALR